MSGSIILGSSSHARELGERYCAASDRQPFKPVDNSTGTAKEARQQLSFTLSSRNVIYTAKLLVLRPSGRHPNPPTPPTARLRSLN